MSGRMEIPVPLLTVKDLVVEFPVKIGLFGRNKSYLRAVDRISFEIAPGETLAIVGESGSGKSTTARGLLRLVEPAGGEVWFKGVSILSLGQNQLRKLRPKFQIVFQDPYSSLNPAMTVGEIVGEPLRFHKREMPKQQRDKEVAETLRLVGLESAYMSRYPYEFSGGQRQRIAIARAIILRPELVVLDEAVSALDVSTQSQVINLLLRLQKELGLTYLFISHDLSLVRYVSHRIAVMYRGQIVEIGSAEQLLDSPSHPYTAALAAAVPKPHPTRRSRASPVVAEAELSSLLEPQSGCRFRMRCPFAMEICRVHEPKMTTTSSGGMAACHLHLEGPRLNGASVLSLLDSNTPWV